MKIDINLIDINKEQPRKLFQNIKELAGSIKKNGLLEPITVRPVGSRYEIVLGERRYRACKLLGYTEIEANVKKLTKLESYKLALVENIQRQDLTPLEEARSFKMLQNKGMSQEDISKLIGKGQSYISHKLRLLKLPEFLTYFLEEGLLSENHMRQLMTIKNIFPKGLKRDFNKNIGAIVIKNKEDATFCIHQLRLRERSAFFRANEEMIRPCNLFIKYVSKHNCQIEQWKVAALWYAFFTVKFKLTVVELATVINLWNESFYDAVGMFYGGVTDKKLYYGYWGDVEHAGCFDLDNKYDDWVKDKIHRLIKKDSYILPSSTMIQNQKEIVECGD